MSRKAAEIFTKSPQNLQLGDCLLDRSTGELMGPDGKNLALRHQSRMVLAYLAQNVGQVVSKKDLMDVVWEGTYVTDDSLVQCVSDIRRALGKKGRQLIQTVPKQGYRLLTAEPVRASKHPIALVWVVVTLALLIAIGWSLWWPEKHELKNTERNSIAVLPFRNLNGNPEYDYFSAGIREDLVTDLSKISNLSVISQVPATNLDDDNFDIRSIGKNLDVSYVLVGSVRKTEDRIRINAQLIDSSTGAHLWAERYDGSQGQIFNLQDQVLHKIIESLTLQLSQKERYRLEARGTDSIAAYDLYMRGLFEESNFSREGNLEAERLYKQALKVDQSYPLPYARLANILEMNAQNGWSRDISSDLQTAVILAKKAVSLDPRNPNLHWSLGRASARLRTPDALRRGIDSMQRAIELEPEFADAYAYLTVLYLSDGRAEEGLKSIETAMNLNRHFPFWYLFMRGMAHYVLQEYNAAIRDFETAAERSPTAPFVRRWLAASYAQIGRKDDAEWQLEELHSMGYTNSIAEAIETSPLQDPVYLNLYKEGLRKAGLSE